MKYTTHNDIYTYKDAQDVLINKFNIKNKDELALFEQSIVGSKLNKLRNLYKKTKSFDLGYLKEIHHYLFSDVYEWAGEIRQIGITKGDTMFCSPGNIERSYEQLHKDMQKTNYLKNIPSKDLAKNLAYYHGELNIIHPFREGNGRVTRAFLNQMLLQSHGLKLDFSNVNKNEFIEASISSVMQDYTKMEDIYKVVLSNSLTKKRELNPKPKRTR